MRKVLITGAGTGFGQEVAMRLAAKGSCRRIRRTSSGSLRYERQHILDALPDRDTLFPGFRVRARAPVPDDRA